MDVLTYYPEFVASLFAKKDEGADGLMHAASGNSGEAGEVLDEIKKHWVYGKSLNRAKIIEELGDQMFYQQALMNLLGVTRTEVVARNVLSLFAKKYEGADGLMHAASGNSVEAGVVLDEIKKHWVYGKPLDRDKVLEELSDQMFYQQALMNRLVVTRTEVIARNVLKLNKRYPDGYSDAAAIARVDQQGS